VDLVTLIEQAIGPLQRRPSGAMVGRCPWHSSRSGTCMVVWPDEGRWWCSSCRRGGDAVQWLHLVEGISSGEARRRLGLAPAPYPARSRPRGSPPREALTVPATWRPAAPELPADWRPGDPLPKDCMP
jgi:hypothetical protein